MTDPNALPSEIAQAWEPETPPDGFAERVVEDWAARKTEAHPDRPRPRWITAAVAVAIAAALLLWLGLRGDVATTGSAHPIERETIALATRAVLVAEAGAQLQWHVADDGTARVQQDAGSVFYRVESGPSFDVVTPHGTITVHGTCFTVEVDAMFNDNKQLKSGLVGAALATAVVVTVYEGQVALADESGQVAVAAGQRAASGPGRTPTVVDEGRANGERDASRRTRASAVVPRRDRNARQARPPASGDDLSAETREAPADNDPVACAHDSRREGCSWVDPSEETLREMARCAVVRIDTPQFLGDRDREPRLPPPALMGLSDAQGQELKQHIIDHKAQHLRELAEMFVEAGGGSPETAEELPTDALIAVVNGLLDPDAMEDERRRIAQERAGLAEPPLDVAALSLAQRWTRHHTDAGDAFERAMADVTGPEVAHAFRQHKDGWPGSKQTFSGACLDPE